MTEANLNRKEWYGGFDGSRKALEDRQAIIKVILHGLVGITPDLADNS